jgi:hypothetical protein
VIISIDAEKAVDATQLHYFKKTSKTRNKGELPQLGKGHLFSCRKYRNTRKI